MSLLLAVAVVRTEHKKLANQELLAFVVFLTFTFGQDKKYGGHSISLPMHFHTVYAACFRPPRWWTSGLTVLNREESMEDFETVYIYSLITGRYNQMIGIADFPETIAVNFTPVVSAVRFSLGTTFHYVNRIQISKLLSSSEFMKLRGPFRANENLSCFPNHILVVDYDLVFF